MPRIPHHLLLRAQNISPLLPLVLRATRTLPSAINELRWLLEHVEETSPQAPPSQQKRQLLRLCERRERGEPLQYILGSQPFGELDIKCRKGVLIPRPETEAYTQHLANLLLHGKLHPELASLKHIYKTRPSRLRILDLCSGSGCISLLLFSLLRKKFPRLRVLGYDISPKAIRLANENLTRNFGPGTGEMGNDDQLHRKVRFRKQDIFEDTAKLKKALDEDHIQFNLKKKHADLENNENTTEVDIIISNPPYINPSAFARKTSRSVRIFEPKLALVPPSYDRYGRNLAKPDDFFFFKRLMELHTELGSKILLMEVGGIAQAYAVAKLAVRKFGGNRVEIWKNHPDQANNYPPKFIKGRRAFKGRYIPIRGRGAPRAVVLFKEESDKDGVSVDAGEGSKVGNGEVSEE